MPNERRPLRPPFFLDATVPPAAQPMAPSIPTSRRSRHVDHPRPPAPASWPASVERLKRRPAETLPASTHRRAGARHRPARSGDKNPRAGEPARGNALWGLGGRIKRAERSNTPSGFLFDRSTQKMHGRRQRLGSAFRSCFSIWNDETQAIGRRRRRSRPGSCAGDLRSVLSPLRCGG